MGMSVWKYELKEPITHVPGGTPEYYKVEMPTCAKVLHVGVAGGQQFPCVWVLVCTDEERSPEHDLVMRTFTIVGTGAPLEDEFEDYKYIGTFQWLGLTVWHAFEVQ